MIERINFKGTNGVSGLKQNVQCNPNKPCQMNIGATEVMSKTSAEAARIAFCGGSKIDVSGENVGLKLNNFLDSDDVITLNDEKNKTKYFLHKTDNGYEMNKETKTDKDIKKGTIFRAEFKDIRDLPEISFKMGKYKPEITIHDPSLNDEFGKEGRIQMFEGSEIKAKKYTLTMPGKSTVYGKHDISFKGKTVITAYNKENKTKQAVDKYFESGLAEKTTRGDCYKYMKDNNYEPTIVIPAGGFGTRFENMTEEDGENKPSFRLPTSNSYRIMATSLNLGAMAGLTGGKGDELVYVSQSEDSQALVEGKNVRKVKSYKTDGGAIAEAIDKNIIPNDKDMIILNADIITNADITRTYKALKTLPNAALIIPYYPVDAKRAQSFGLMGLEKDEKGNMQIKDFIEKPPHTDEEPPL